MKTNSWLEELRKNYITGDKLENFIEKVISQEKEKWVGEIIKRRKEWHKNCLTDDFINGRFWEADEIINLLQNK